MRVLFMGTPDFAEESLRCLVEAKYEIVGVVTNPDRPKGRGMKLVGSPVKQFAESEGFEIYQPEKVKNNLELVKKIKELNPDVICVVAYGKILPKEVLDIPRYGCINVHASLLPKYRGAAPIQWAVLNGDKLTGVTTMCMDIGMDTGDILLKEEVEIGENETTGELWNRLAKIGGNLLVKTLIGLENDSIKRCPQAESFTMAPMLNKEMAKIDWENKSAIEIKNLVRGLNPIMGAYVFLNDKKIKFWSVDVVTDIEDIGVDEIEKLENGTVLVSNPKEGLYIKTKDGILKVLEIQGENAKRMGISDFLRGNVIEKLMVFK